MKDVKNIENINDLIAVLGKEKVDALFMEYALLTTYKAGKFDAIVSALDNKGCLIDDIQEIIEDDNDGEYFV